MKTFGQVLRRIRQEKELYLKDIANYMGWSVVYVSDIERGNRNPPSKKDILKLCRHLGINSDELLNLAENQRGFIELNLNELNKEQRTTALSLARKMNHLDDEQLKRISEIINCWGSCDE